MPPLPRRRRRRIARRARFQTRPAARRIERAAQREVRGLRRQSGRQTRAIRGATRQTVRDIGSVNVGGLGGRLAAQIRAEKQGAIADTRGFGRAIASGVRREARGEIQGLRAGAAQDASDLIFNRRQALTNTALQRRSTARRTEQGATRADPEFRQKVKLALRIGRQMLARFPGQEPASKAEWARFTRTLAGQMGDSQIGWQSALRAAKRLQGEGRRTKVATPRAILGSRDFPR